jgi:YVTN family beta-propeller protein
MASVRRVVICLLLVFSIASAAEAQTRIYALQTRYLYVLDGSTFQQLSRLDLFTSGNPSGIAVTGNGTRAYIGLGGNSSGAQLGETAIGPQPRVAVLDLRTLTVIHTIDVGTLPIDVVASPSGDRVYVANNGGPSVSVIRTSDDTVVATVPLPVNPQALAVTRDAAQVYATGSLPGTAASAAVAISTTTFAVGSSYTAPGCADGVAISPDGSRLYVSGVCAGTPSLFVYDTATGARTGEGATSPTGRLALTSDGTKLVAGASNLDSTIVYDTATMTQLANKTPSGALVVIEPSQSRAFTWGRWGNTSFGTTQLNAVDLTTYTVTKVFEPGGSQFSGTGLAIAPAPSTAPAMALDKTSLIFAAVSNGASFTSQTPAQTVRLSQSGGGTVPWTATSSAPWLVVSPTSGIGPAILSISTRFVFGLAESQTGTITVALTGAANAVGPVNVTLTTVPANAPVSPPFGVVDTPAGDSTVLAGSVAVTGWTLDNIGVKRVELWRDLQPGETTTPFSSTPTDPRNGKVFIASPAFVDGARPDLEALYPSTPTNYRGGWGYLLLTWGLWNQGNGTYRLYAFAFDQEDNVATIGTKSIVVNNNAATKPFGSIDTPTVGGDASGANFGWALTPKVNGVATCRIPANGVQVSIDSGPLQHVDYGDARSDVAAAFPGFSNSAAAGGHFLFDWSTLTNGPHTIGWLITDDCNRADGVGSRFFNVTGGKSLSRASPEMAAAVLRVGQIESDAAITVAHGYGELPEIVAPGEAGSRTVEVRQGDRIEIRLPRGFDSAYQLGAGGRQRPLPAGATWDTASAIFYWQPAPAFLGRYRLVFSNGSERISIRVIVSP